METQVVMAIVGGVITLVNSIVGIVLTSLYKSQALMQAALAQQQSDIRVHTVQLTHICETLTEHTESDQVQFQQVRDQQRELHQENLKALQDIQYTLHVPLKRRPDERRS